MLEKFRDNPKRVIDKLHHLRRTQKTSPPDLTNIPEETLNEKLERSGMEVNVIKTIPNKDRNNYGGVFC